MQERSGCDGMMKTAVGGNGGVEEKNGEGNGEKRRIELEE